VACQVRVWFVNVTEAFDDNSTYKKVASLILAQLESAGTRILLDLEIPLIVSSVPPTSMSC
jgi:hypothetical protein